MNVKTALGMPLPHWKAYFICRFVQRSRLARFARAVADTDVV